MRLQQVSTKVGVEVAPHRVDVVGLFSKLRVNRRRELQAKDELSDIWKQLLAS